MKQFWQYLRSRKSRKNKTMNVMEKQEKKRHGFVTFWLWMGIIGSFISIPFSIMTYQNFANLGHLGMQLVIAGVDLTSFNEAIGLHVLVMQVVAAILGICMIVFYAMLLNWRKNGFWGILVTGILVAIVDFVMMNLIEKDYATIGLGTNLMPFTQMIATPISILILWAILHIKKNGVSCWSILE